MKNIFVTILFCVLSTVTTQGQTFSLKPFVRLEPSKLLMEEFSKGKPVKETVLQFTDRAAMGAGTIISNDGYILTNYHVVNFQKIVPMAGEDNYRRFSSAGSDMLVYINVNNDSSKESQVQYRASLVAADEASDIAILKIDKDQNGQSISAPAVDFSVIGNPYTIGENGEIALLGYGIRGSKKISIIPAIYLGVNSEDTLIGTMKYSAGKTDGNNGGAIVFNNTLVGIPTMSSLTNWIGITYGYFTPVTWATRTLATVSLKQGKKDVAIDPSWAHASSGDKTASSVPKTFIGGTLKCAQTKKTVQDTWVYVYRTDRTLEHIKTLDDEMTSLGLTLQMKELQEKGKTPEQIAEMYGTSVEDVQQNLAMDMTAVSADAQKMLNGEFIYQVEKTDEEGFFLAEVPADMKLKLSCENDPEYVPLTKEIVTGKGFANALDEINIYMR